MSFELKFLCADIFPCEDSKTVSVCLPVRLSLPREKKSPWLRQYQSYRSKWYINGKVFTSTTVWKLKKIIFFSKNVENEFWLVFGLKSKYWNHPSFVNISHAVVIGTWMERFSEVLQHGNPPKFIFLKKCLSVSAVVFCKQF